MIRASGSSYTQGVPAGYTTASTGGRALLPEGRLGQRSATLNVLRERVTASRPASSRAHSAPAPRFTRFNLQAREQDREWQATDSDDETLCGEPEEGDENNAVPVSVNTQGRLPLSQSTPRREMVRHNSEPADLGSQHHGSDSTVQDPPEQPPQPPPKKKGGFLRRFFSSGRAQKEKDETIFDDSYGNQNTASPSQPGQSGEVVMYRVTRAVMVDQNQESDSTAQGTSFHVGRGWNEGEGQWG